MLLDKKTVGYRLMFWITIIVVGLFLFFPLYWLLITALKPQEELFRAGFFPAKVTLENFKSVLDDPQIRRYFINSLFVSLTSALLSTAVSLLAAYSFSKFRYRGKKSLMSFILISRVFPQAVLLLTIYQMMRALHLTGSYLSLILSFMVFTLPVGTWTMKAYFDQIPDSLLESARIDGAKNIKIMIAIVLPLVIPGLISVAIYSFVWAWNDLLYSLTLVTSADMRTLAAGLILKYTGEFGSNWGNMMAASIVVSIPVTLMFVFLQRYFIAGMVSGAVKE